MNITNNTHYPKVLVFLQFSLIGLMLVSSSGFSNSLLALGISFIGAVLGIWALAHNKLGNFNIQPKMKEKAKLITTGIYAYIRHPMYTAVILLMLGVLLSTPNFMEWIFFILLIGVLLLKAKKEESLWLKENQEYVNYKKRTKYFIPFVL